jgi:hypothetical protein
VREGVVLIVRKQRYISVDIPDGNTRTFMTSVLYCDWSDFTTLIHYATERTTKRVV